MREISTKKVNIGEHILLDNVEYEAVEGRCVLCEFFDRDTSPCPYSYFCPIGVMFKRVKKEPQYRPYKDTDEMIADYKERFNVSNIPAFCMPLIWVKDKPNFLTTVGTHLIVEIFEHVVRLSNSLITVQNLFDNYTYFDGSPCGKAEE